MKKRLAILLAICLLNICVLSAGCAEGAGGKEGIDVDFSRMGATVAQAQFNNLLANSGDYIGQTIRASGEFFSLYINEFDRYFHFVTVVAGDGCCPPDGFEIQLTGDNVSSDDYPEQYTMIEVIGVLDSYDEHGFAFLYLAIDEITII